MNAVESIRAKLGVEAPWVREGGVLWLANAANVRTLAAVMREAGSRFVTITATELPGHDGIRLDYLWDVEGQLLGFPVYVADNSVESICDICEAADWIEREVREGFAVNFTGREYEPLLLRAGDRPGVNLREVTP